MAKPKGPFERSLAWAKKWADYNYPELPNDEKPEQRALRSAQWIGWFQGGCKGWYAGYKAGRASVGKNDGR